MPFMLRTSDQEYITNKKGEEKKNLHWKVNTEEDLININKKLLHLRTNSESRLLLPEMFISLMKRMRNSVQSLWRQRALMMRIIKHLFTSKQLMKCWLILLGQGTEQKEFVIDNPNKIADMVMDNIPPIPQEPSSLILMVRMKS